MLASPSIWIICNINEIDIFCSTSFYFFVWMSVFQTIYNDLRPFVFSLNACEVIKVSILPKRKQINKRNWQSCNKIFSFQSRIHKFAIGHTGLHTIKTELPEYSLLQTAIEANYGRLRVYLDWEYQRFINSYHGQFKVNT